jgi:hypothetical protein
LSSTIDRLGRLFGRRRSGPAKGRESGQVLVIFAFGAIGILAVAALVFDVGQNLFERRKQQDAADAAALAGARWLPVAACRAAESVATCPQAYAAALDLATDHGYAASQVTVNIPPVSGPFAGYKGHLQVAIQGSRGSYFAGVVGIAGFSIGASAVAANINEYPLPYSILSLNPTACKAGHIHGNGTLDVEGSIMVNSTCTSPGALAFDGNPVTVTVGGDCATGGQISTGSSSTTTCDDYLEDQTPVADPLTDLKVPVIGSAVVPAPPAAVNVTGLHLASNRAPNGCPGSTSPATAANPTGCDINFNRDKVVRIYPGVYYGGLKIRQTSSALTVYMAPGIYYMSGGGFEVSGSVILRTVDAESVLNPLPTAFGGGVLIYNTDNATTCSTSGTGCIRAVDFANTSGGDVRMRGYTGKTYTGMVIWQDRKASSQPPMSMEGNSTTTLKGAIYLPKADFKYTGNGGGNVLDAQVICDEFDVGGNGNLTVTYDPDDAIKIGGAGLVQ